jgi:zinc transporter, ZIP family
MGGDLILLAVAGTGTALATGLGAIPVFVLGARADGLRPLLWGIAAGVMTVASVVGLLRPALDAGPPAAVGGGLAGGVLLLVASWRALATRNVHVGALRGAGVRRSLLVLGVLFVHSLPEGFAIGTAFASERAGLGAFVLLAIALQNVPEGTASAIPVRDAGFTSGHQFWAAVATSTPQPVGAVGAFVLVAQMQSLLPISFAFAAGAMLALMAIEIAPQALTARTWQPALLGAAAGGALMFALSTAIGV